MIWKETKRNQINFLPLKFLPKEGVEVCIIWIIIERMILDFKPGRDVLEEKQVSFFWKIGGQTICVLWYWLRSEALSLSILWVAWLNYYLLHFQLLFTVWMLKSRLNPSSVEVNEFLFLGLKLTSDEVHLIVIRLWVCGQPVLESRTHTRPTGPLWMAECGRIKS